MNDVSRELGSALGIAVLGNFISAFYRGNIDDTLGGQADESVLDTAKDGLGGLTGRSAELAPEVAQTAFAGAGDAFIDAMNSGFWLSTIVLGSAVVVAAGNSDTTGTTREDSALVDA